MYKQMGYYIGRESQFYLTGMAEGRIYLDLLAGILFSSNGT